MPARPDQVADDADRAAPGGGEPALDARSDSIPELIPDRIERILLVASPYDAFMLDENGLLTELIYSEYADLGLTHAPEFTQVSSAHAALQALHEGEFDLVIMTQRLGDMDIRDVTRRIHGVQPDLPVVLLVTNEAELGALPGPAEDSLGVDSVYVWAGDAKIFLAIIKAVEDRWNVDHDTRSGGVGVIILIEDSRRFRSSLLPIMYAELVAQTRAVMADGLNRTHRLARMRARPKILVVETFEAALECLTRYRDHLFGVITDVSFRRGATQDPQAGAELIRQIKQECPDLPILMQSSEPGNKALADALGVSFLHKRSSTLLEDVRAFMLNNFGFGDFVFRLPEGYEVARAADLRAMVRELATVPARALEYHAARNHFSNWLRARTEFDLARRLRLRAVTDFADLEALRRYLIAAFREALRQNRRGRVEDFARDRFDAGSHMARIGGGSLGGKARGLAFTDALLAHSDVERAFPDVHIHVPRCVVVGSDVFDEFLESNRLRLAALRNDNEDWLAWAFRTAELPAPVVQDLRTYLFQVFEPLAVRSSSLLEDSEHYPLAGVYATYMLPNNHADINVRLTQLSDAIKLVYASTFSAAARRYLEATPHRIEEEKMAVIVQPVVGRRRGTIYYPSFAGVANSYNFYPFGHMRPDDGVAYVALGLGAEVVDGGQALRFCPRHPQVLPELGDGPQFVEQSQRAFLAVDLGDAAVMPAPGDPRPVASFGLDVAAAHQTLDPVGSVWSYENSTFHDGLDREGAPVVTFSRVLKHDLFPLAPIIDRLLQIGRAGMNGPVEVEFAGNLDPQQREFAILQMRPSAGDRTSAPVEIGRYPRDALLCQTPQALGNGVVDGLCDVVYVKPDRFEPALADRIAADVAACADHIRRAERRFLLIGPGRWGSSNRSLGVPVQWHQISGARVIVEASSDLFQVDPSQGSHFFHNLTSMGVAYLTVGPRAEGSFVDWDWLAKAPAVSDSGCVRHVELPVPLEVRIDGRRSRAVILKCRPESRGG